MRKRNVFKGASGKNFKKSRVKKRANRRIIAGVSASTHTHTHARIGMHTKRHKSERNCLDSANRRVALKSTCIFNRICLVVVCARLCLGMCMCVWRVLEHMLALISARGDNSLFFVFVLVMCASAVPERDIKLTTI